MTDFLYDAKYDACRHHIDMARRNGTSWEHLLNHGMEPDVFDSWLKLQETASFWPNLGATPTEREKKWKDIVAAKRVAEETSISATRPLVIVGNEETEPGINVPEDGRSAWQLYKEYLLKQEWKESSVKGIETSALKILRHLRKNTLQRKNPVKGLVVGHVQSGKTASMAGLIAMSADHGWNIFIVLSGTLDNLRVQTKNRLFKDLNQPGNLLWQVEDHPSPNSGEGHRAQDKQFQSGAIARHLIVSIKNSIRLQALLDWLKANPASMKQMKIVIIDDEADQAGINTADVSAEERTKINRLIIALVNIPALSVNYVAYTATPAANFLNESPGAKALYPDDFIVCLQQSDEHFGPLQIFGAPEIGYSPLGIVRELANEELVAIRELHDGKDAGLPASLQEAVIWFLCCVAAMRKNGFKKPVSMLIHTSQRQAHHDNVGDALRGYLRKQISAFKSFLDQCRTVWEDVKSDLNSELFAERYPLYGRLAQIQDYPPFESIQEQIYVLLTEISAIKLDESKTKSYHNGIHLCIDNCANNGISNENEIRRLLYPSPDALNAPDFATAFIVIGGSTLARGLTLENLVSTYFLRASAQADSLMQMGRWFGYRKGYELLPRIWMPGDTVSKFEFMTVAEEDLRDDLQRFMYAGSKPSEFGPRVRVSPRGSWLRPTAKSRMQQSIPSDYDFSGVNRQTTIFHDGEGSQEAHMFNKALTEDFLNNLDEAKFISRGTVLIWKDVNFDTISEFLVKFRFHPYAQFFCEISPFVQWYNENFVAAGYGNWNVVVAGTKSKKEKTWKIKDFEIGLINRSRVPRRSSDGAVSIGVLRDPRDLLADAELADDIIPKELSNETIISTRIKGEVGNIPQLLIYLIDKNSFPRKQAVAGDNEPREFLNAREHIVGISIWLPEGGRKKGGFVSHLTVRIPGDLISDEDELHDSINGDQK